MKLTREKLNELLYYINSDNSKYSLILQLLYTYGRNANEVYGIKTQDINPVDKEITFNINNTLVDYPLMDYLEEPLINYIQEQEYGSDDYLFRREDETMEMAVKKLNYYLEKTIDSLNRTLDLNWPKLTTKDFKLLRGQHLLLDGADLHVVHDLYNNSNITSTRSYLNYDELLKLKFPCHDLKTAFEEYTDLNIFHDDRFEDTDIFTVGDDHDSIVIEIDYTEDIIQIISEETHPIAIKLEEIPADYLSANLRKLKPGDYKFINSLRFIKN